METFTKYMKNFINPLSIPDHTDNRNNEEKHDFTS